MKASWKYALALIGIILIVACSGGGGGGDSTTQAQSGNWIDNNGDGIYDPYQDQVLWSQMNTMVAQGGFWLSPGAAYAATRAWRGNGNPSPSWRDSNGDGVCDYAQDPNLWSRSNAGDWIDTNNDGICDNYPNNSQWKGGWR